MRALTIAFTVALLGTAAEAAPVEIGFRAVVTDVYVHPIVDNPFAVLPIGAVIAGGYSYEINPGNPAQTINGRLWFTAGSVTRDNLGLTILMRQMGEINWAYGDLYQAISPNLSSGESYEIDLESAGGIALGPDFPAPPDLLLFDVRANFVFSADTTPRTAQVLTTARLTDLYLIDRLAIPAPAGLGLLVFGLILLCRR